MSRAATEAGWRWADEIRVYADALCGLLRGAFPRTMALYEEGRRK